MIMILLQTYLQSLFATLKKAHFQAIVASSGIAYPFYLEGGGEVKQWFTNRS